MPSAAGFPREPPALRSLLGALFAGCPGRGGASPRAGAAPRGGPGERSVSRAQPGQGHQCGRAGPVSAAGSLWNQGCESALGRCQSECWWPFFQDTQSGIKGRVDVHTQSLSCFKHGVKNATVAGLSPVQNDSRPIAKCSPHAYCACGPSVKILSRGRTRKANSPCGSLISSSALMNARDASSSPAQFQL